MIDETIEDIPNSKDYARRLVELESLSVNSVYGELLAYLKTQRESIMDSVFVSPTSVEGILARERMFGVAEEYEVLLSWLDNEILDAREKFEQLKLEEQQAKEETNHDN